MKALWSNIPVEVRWAAAVGTWGALGGFRSGATMFLCGCGLEAFKWWIRRDMERTRLGLNATYGLDLKP